MTEAEFWKILSGIKLVNHGGVIRDPDGRCPICAVAFAAGEYDGSLAYWTASKKIGLPPRFSDYVANAADKLRNCDRRFRRKLLNLVKVSNER